MAPKLIDTLKIIDTTIGEYWGDPVDLLNIGDEHGENAYLKKAKLSYGRTIRDVLTLNAQQPVGEGPIRVLEIGSYLGIVSIVLARLGFSVTALDIPEFMANSKLQERYRRHGVTTRSVNLREGIIPADSEEFDLVIMCETLEHFDFNPVPVFREINRVLQTGGVLYLSLPNHASLVNRAKLLCGQSLHNPINDFFNQLRKDCNMIVGIHWREYTKREIAELLEATGFSIESHYYFTSTMSVLPARILYMFFPSLRPNQTAIARRVSVGDTAS